MPIGVVTGLLAEEACLGAGGGQVIHACHGPGAQQAAKAAASLCDRGAEGLVSFGMAGGIAPYLEPGDLVLATAIRLKDDSSIPTDRFWTARLNHALARLNLRPYSGPLYADDIPAIDPNRKRVLFTNAGAFAVDMESHGIARLAAKRGVPFVCLRAVVDPSALTIPKLALRGLGPDGRTRVLPVLARVLLKPWFLPALIRLSAYQTAALKSLRAAAPALSGAGAPALRRA